MKKLFVGVCMVMMLIFCAVACNWFDAGSSPDPMCNLFVTITHFEDCQYFISFEVLPCSDEVRGYFFKWEDFNQIYIPAVNGQATFEHDFWYEGHYVIDAWAIDDEGDKIAAYSEAHEIHCWSN